MKYHIKLVQNSQGVLQFSLDLLLGRSKMFSPIITGRKYQNDFISQVNIVIGTTKEILMF